MSSTLRLTPARLALLQAVADGKVTRQRPMLPDPIYVQLDHGVATERDSRLAPLSNSRLVRVTARVAYLERAGLVHCALLVGDDPHPHAPRLYRPTVAGQALLDNSNGGAP